MSDEADEWDRMRTHVRKALIKFPQEVRFRALNACEGIDRAERLLEVDREMASFRAITAEEEAAAALFAALKRMKYPGADRLNLWTHPHKAALWLFLDAVRNSLANDFHKLQMTFSVNSETPELVIKIPVRQLVDVPEGFPDLAFQPVDPFGMTQRVGGETYTFKDDIEQIVISNGGKTVDRYVRKLSNQRNRLLYASESMLPKSQVTLEIIHHRRAHIYWALIITIGILQTNNIQLSAAQCLQGFLRIIGLGDELPALREP